MQHACAEAAQWRNPLDIAVNISPLQFQQGDLPEQIHTILSANRPFAVAPGAGNHRNRAYRRFRSRTVDVATPQSIGIAHRNGRFGTGWSSLSSLQAFPFDNVKIDRTFIDKLGRHKQADVIVRAVLSLCRSLEIPVLAEGVETEEQLEFLRREGCDELQGYLLSRPAPIATFAEFLETTGSRPGLIKVA